MMVARAAGAAFVVASVGLLWPAVGRGQKTGAPPRPTVGTLVPSSGPAPTRTQLANGVRVTTLANGHAPKALIQVVIETGAEDADECRLTRVLADVFRHGDATLTGAGLTDSIAHMGGALGASTRPEGIDLTLEVLSPYAVPAVELLGHIVRDPRLDSATTSLATHAATDRGPRGRTDISAAAVEAFQTALFPHGAFGRPCTAPGRVAQYTAADVRTFYRARVTAPHTKVYVVGRFDRTAVERAVARAFGTWPRGAGGDTQSGSASAAAPALAIVHQPGAKQVALVVGARVPGPADTDFVRLRIADAMLGGSLVSRITVNIREAKGYAYGPTSRIVVAPSGVAFWAEITNVAASVGWPALREIIKEIQRLGSESPPDSELTGTQRFVIGRTMVERATRAGRLEALEAEDVATSRGAGTGDEMQRMQAVTAADIRRVVGGYINPRDLTIVVVGDTTLMADQMGDLRRGVEALRAGPTTGTH
jgi:zinc protease